MLLNGKTAIIFGAGGAIGGAVAKAFAREGARVFLSGRNGAPTVLRQQCGVERPHKRAVWSTRETSGANKRF